MASFDVTHTFKVLSRGGNCASSLVILENNEFHLPAQEFLKEVKGWDANCSKRCCKSYNLCSVLEFETERCFLDSQVNGMKVFGAMSTKNTPPVDFMLSRSPA